MPVGDVAVSSVVLDPVTGLESAVEAWLVGDAVPLSVVGGIGMVAVDVVMVEVPEVTGLAELVGVVTVVVGTTVVEP